MGKEEMAAFTSEKMAGRVAVGDARRHAIASHRHAATSSPRAPPVLRHATVSRLASLPEWIRRVGDGASFRAFREGKYHSEPVSMPG